MRARLALQLHYANPDELKRPLASNSGIKPDDSLFTMLNELKSREPI